MTQHTPGRLKVRGFINLRTEAGNHPVASCNQQGLDHADEANARRLVAAWNACDGISTNELETTGGAAVGWARTASKLIHATKQRDELITALGACRDAMPPSAVDISEAIGYPTSVPAYVSKSVALLVAQRDKILAALKHIEGVAMADEWRDLPEIAKHARAAIAKVQGGEA